MDHFEAVKKAMARRNTQQLAQIWAENDRDKYTDEELDAVRAILRKRNHPLPQQKRPLLLFHGSTSRHEVLITKQAHDMGDSRGCKQGIYATPIREQALMFTLGIVPDEKGRRFAMAGRAPFPMKLIYVYGRPNVGGKGYLYTLDPSSFREVALYQWVAEGPVSPLDIQEINVDDYLYLVAAVTKDDWKWLRNRFPDFDEIISVDPLT